MTYALLFIGYLSERVLRGPPRKIDSGGTSAYFVFLEWGMERATPLARGMAVFVEPGSVSLIFERLLSSDEFYYCEGFPQFPCLPFFDVTTGFLNSIQYRATWYALCNRSDNASYCIALYCIALFCTV